MQIISRVDAKAAGLKRFFTGQPCKNGHISERLISSGTCLVCDAEKKRQLRADPIASIKIRELDKKSKSTPESLIRRKEYNSKYYSKQENRERILKNQQVLNKKRRSCPELKEIDRQWNLKYMREKRIERAKNKEPRVVVRRVRTKSEVNAAAREAYRARREKFLNENPWYKPKFGFDPNSESWVYILHIKFKEDFFVGYGITKDLKKRMSRHRVELKKRGGVIVNSSSVLFNSGYDALVLENEFNTISKNCKKLDVIGFKKESLLGGLDSYNDFVCKSLNFAAGKNAQSIR